MMKRYIPTMFFWSFTLINGAGLLLGTIAIIATMGGSNMMGVMLAVSFALWILLQLTIHVIHSWLLEKWGD